MTDSDGRQSESLAGLLSFLRAQGYAFITPTPETHGRVAARPGSREAEDLRGIFGWSLAFRPDLVPAEVLQPLIDAELVQLSGPLFKARIRVSSLHGQLFVHSAYPTDAEDAVFFGPDSYRFVDFVRGELAWAPGTQRLVDIGAGAGVGAIMAAPLLPGARLTLTDVNPRALLYARVNAAHAGVAIETIEGSGLDAVTGPFDLAIANPPYIIDAKSRTYRDGGGMHGALLSLEWALAATERLAPGGRMLLYTGSAIVGGRDALCEALEARLPALGATLRYRELDPDIFGEELSKPGYEDVERIAAVGAVITRAPSI